MNTVTSYLGGSLSIRQLVKRRSSKPTVEEAAIEKEAAVKQATEQLGVDKITEKAIKAEEATENVEEEFVCCGWDGGCWCT